MDMMLLNMVDKVAAAASIHEGLSKYRAQGSYANGVETPALARNARGSTRRGLRRPRSPGRLRSQTHVDGGSRPEVAPEKLADRLPHRRLRMAWRGARQAR